MGMSTARAKNQSNSFPSSLRGPSAPAKRAVDLHYYVCKGGAALRMIEENPPSTQVPTTQDLANGWKLDEEAYLELNDNLLPALDGLGIPHDDNVQAKSWAQIKVFTDQQGNIHPPTGGYYDTLFIAHSDKGTIIATNNVSPEKEAPGAALPPIWRWSDVVWAQWTELAGAQASKLRYIIRDNVATDITRALIEYVEGSHPDNLNLPWPGHMYDMQQWPGQALLGSPHGIGVAYMITAHSNVLGRRSPWVRIFTALNTDPDINQRWNYYMVWELRDT
ncbi:MAG: hypothetical protein Q9201_002056 [Fulgogasparrea decipioides]